LDSHVPVLNELKDRVQLCQVCLIVMVSDVRRICRTLLSVIFKLMHVEMSSAPERSHPSMNKLIDMIQILTGVTANGYPHQDPDSRCINSLTLKVFMVNT
jgi:hypothetical protein